MTPQYPPQQDAERRVRKLSIMTYSEFIFREKKICAHYPSERVQHSKANSDLLRCVLTNHIPCFLLFVILVEINARSIKVTRKHERL